MSTRKYVVKGIAYSSVIAWGFLIAQTAFAQESAHDRWVQRENEQTAIEQQEQAEARFQAALQACEPIAAYWQAHHVAFDLDSCIADPVAAANAIVDDKNRRAQDRAAREQAQYEAAQADYARERAAYDARVREYQRRLAEQRAQEQAVEEAAQRRDAYREQYQLNPPY